jgi:hypothetical protein
VRHIIKFVKVPHYVSRISEAGSKHWEAVPNDSMNGDRGGDPAFKIVAREAIQ